MRNLARTGFIFMVAIAIAACGGGLRTPAMDASDTAVANPDQGATVGDLGSDTIAKDAADDISMEKPDAASAPPDTGNSVADANTRIDARVDGAVDVQSADGSLGADGAAGECADALPLKCGDRLDHSTLVQGRADVWSGYGRTQRLESGRETVYVLATPAACQVVARLKNLTVDLDLLLLTSCGPWSNTQASSTPLDLQTIETITFATEASQPYFVVVDGYSGAAGTYTLEVDCTCQ